MNLDATLQERFLESRGKPVLVDDDVVIQQDSIKFPGKSIVKVHILGDEYFVDNGVVLSINSPGALYLSDGEAVKAIKIWDDLGLPRTICHVVLSEVKPLKVHNKYKVKHGSGEITEENFTGNAGMVVTELAPNRRRYECSNGPGPFSKDALVFEVEWNPCVNWNSGDTILNSKITGGEGDTI